MAKKPSRFLTVGNIILLVFGIIGVVCLVVFAIRANNYQCRTKELASEAEAKPLESKGPTPKTPTPQLPESETTQPKEVTESKSDPFVTESKLHQTCETYYTKAKRFVCDKIRGLKDFVVKCQNESPPIRTPGMRGRKQNDVRAFQFERAVLYQMAHGRCSPHNACQKSFLKLENGYTGPRSIYDYWQDHQLEVDALKKSLATTIAGREMTAKKYYETHYLENKSKLREINT